MTLTEFITSHKASLMRRITHRGVLYPGTDDVFQEVYLGYLRLPMRGDSLTDYRRVLHSVVHYAVLRYYQSQSGRMGSPRQVAVQVSDADAPDPRRSSHESRRDLWETVKPLCQGLSTAQRLVVILKYMEGWNGTEISQHFGKSRRMWATEVLRKAIAAYRERCGIVVKPTSRLPEQSGGIACVMHD